jgi:hypothetical protein
MFLILYFAYKYIPFAPLKIICAIAESNFQHYKAGFFSWIIISLFEYCLLGKKVGDIVPFFYSRTATAAIIPWIIFILWYLGPAIYGKMPSISLEIVYANIITLTAGIFGAVFEQGMAGINYSRELKIVIIVLCLSSVLLFLVFTFIKLPWADVFTEPDWR